MQHANKHSISMRNVMNGSKRRWSAMLTAIPKTMRYGVVTKEEADTYLLEVHHYM